MKKFAIGFIIVVALGLSGGAQKQANQQ